MKPTRIPRNFWKWCIIKNGFIHLSGNVTPEEFEKSEEVLNGRVY